MSKNCRKRSEETFVPSVLDGLGDFLQINGIIHIMLKNRYLIKYILEDLSKKMVFVGGSSGFYFHRNFSIIRITVQLIKKVKYFCLVGR